MPSNQFIGRRVSVGVGIETTPGTEVAPTDWFRFLSLDFQRKTTVIDNESALGRVEKINDSAIVEQWAEGKLEGKVTDILIGYLLYNMMGSKSTAANADASGTIKDHTLDIAQVNVAPTITLARKDPLTDRRHGLGTLEDLEISGAAGDWVKLSATIKAKAGVSASDTPALVTEREFTIKHVTAKLATNVGGLGAATALAVKSFRIRLNRGATPFFSAGSVDPSAMTTGAFEVTGELVLQYTDTTLEDLWAANTQRALQLSIKNTDVTIGTSANPALVFTAPRVRLNTFNMSNDLDNVIEQTIGFKAELDESAGYMLRAVLTNSKASY